MRFLLNRLYCRCLRRASRWDRRHRKLAIKRAYAQQQADVWHRRCHVAETAHQSYINTLGDSDAD